MGVKVAAPAKINLTLDVIGRLPNGYHTVEMVMQTIDLTDVITVAPADRLSLTIENAALAADDSNTAWKAVELYSAAVGIQPHFAVTVQKNIPMQAGLAGGSADAAGVLVACNALCDTCLSVDALCEIGAKIGADVPFCIRGGTVLATGIGTDLKTLPMLPPCYIVVAKPPCNVSTAAAYAAIDRLPYPTATHTADMCGALAARDITAVGNAMHNRFAEALPIEQVQRLLEIITQNDALGACMTGSGSAVIGVFADARLAAACAAALQPYSETVSVCRPWHSGPKIV